MRNNGYKSVQDYFALANSIHINHADAIYNGHTKDIRKHGDVSLESL